MTRCARLERAPRTRVFTATAVTIPKLEPVEIRDALTAHAEKKGFNQNDWVFLTRSLGAAPDGALADALSTPWMLTLALHRLEATKDSKAAADELANCPSACAVQDKLFAELIPAAVNTQYRDKAVRYQAKQVHHWLAGLAQHLAIQRRQGQGGTDIALHELWRMAGSRAPRYLHGLAGLAFGLVFGLAVELASGLVFGLGSGLALGLLAGLGSGLPAGLVATRSSLPPQRLVLRTGRTGALRQRLGHRDHVPPSGYREARGAGPAGRRWPGWRASTTPRWPSTGPPPYSAYAHAVS